MCTVIAFSTVSSCFSDSLGIGSITERILLGVCTVDLLAMYDRSHTSEVTLSIYFDRDIRLSVDSSRIFGRPGTWKEV